MKTILIANSKGGSGKTTIAVSLASAWACAGLKTTLVDADPQKSANQWLKRRSVYCAHIDRTDWAGRAETLQFAKGTQRVIIDSPSALTSKQISEKFGNIDAVVVPLSSSLFDEIATKKFLSSLQRLERVNHGETHIHRDIAVESTGAGDCCFGGVSTGQRLCAKRTNQLAHSICRTGASRTGDF